MPFSPEIFYRVYVRLNTVHVRPKHCRRLPYESDVFKPRKQI